MFSSVLPSPVVFSFLVFSLSAAQPAMAQDGDDSQTSSSQGTVRGVVVDAEEGGPVPGASVALHSAADSSLVTGTVTAGDGSFSIEGVRPGSYYLRVSYVGYAPAVVSDVSVSEESSAVDMGEIVLRQSAEQLEDVEVTAEREYMEVGADRTTYNPQNQPVLAGGSARSVLENIPSIQIDIDGNISFRGNQGVAIHLNGSPTPMTGEALTSFLQGLSADDIERVEVIPNPSAAYDPEGTGGIINIVLAEGTEIGWGGGLSASAGTRGRYNGSANAHYGSGPWQAYANYSARYDRDEDSGWRYRENRYLDPTTYLEQDRWSERSGLSNTFHTSLDYTPSEKNSFSLSAVVSHRGDDENRLNEYSELDGDRTLARRYDRRTDAEDTDFSMDYEFEYSRVWTPREHEFDLEVEYEESRETEREIYTQYALPLDAPGGEPSDENGTLADRQEADEGEHEREASLEADYQRSFGEAVELEAGYDGEFEWQDSRYDSESLDSTGALAPDRNDTFTYAEQTHSLYTTLEGSLGDFGAQLGVRAEGALTTFEQETLGETFDNRYFSLFPSVHLSYQPGERNTIRASYSKRVRRPSTWQLNPLGNYTDPTFRRVGNPGLTPEYTHSFEVSYTRQGDQYTVSLSPYYRYTVDEISWSEELTEDGVTILTFENFATEDSYGAELVGSLTLGERFKGNASFNAYKQVTDGSNLSSSLSSDAIGFRTRASLTADLGWGVTVQGSQYYRSPMDIPGGRRDARIWTNVALQKKLLDDRLTLNLRARDLFGAQDHVTERLTEDYYREYSRESDPRSVRLTFRYTFGRSGDDGDGRRRR